VLVRLAAEPTPDRAPARPVARPLRRLGFTSFVFLTKPARSAASAWDRAERGMAGVAGSGGGGAAPGDRPARLASLQRGAGGWSDPPGSRRRDIVSSTRRWPHQRSPSNICESDRATRLEDHDVLTGFYANIDRCPAPWMFRQRLNSGRVTVITMGRLLVRVEERDSFGKPHSIALPKCGTTALHRITPSFSYVTRTGFHPRDSSMYQ